MRRDRRTFSFLWVLSVLLITEMLMGCATQLYQPSQQVLNSVSVVDAKNTASGLYRQNIPNGTLIVHADRLEFHGRHFNGNCLYDTIPDPKVDDYGALAGQYHVGDRYMVDLGYRQQCTMVMFKIFDDASAFANAMYVLKYTPLQMKLEQLEPIVQPGNAETGPAITLPPPLPDGTEEFEQAKAANTFDAYDGFLKAFPSSTNRRPALQAMAALIETQNGSYEDCKKFVAAYEDGLEFVPEKHRMALTGPEGLRVGDIAGFRRKGVGNNIIAAKIRSCKGRYKDFSFDEIDQLKKMGISEVVIEAMIESTSRVTRDAEEMQKKKNMEELLAEIQRMQKKLDDLKTAQASGAAVPVPAGQSQGPSVVDTVKNCAAQITALEACKHLPSLGAMVCKAAAKSQFPCE